MIKKRRAQKLISISLAFLMILGLRVEVNSSMPTSSEGEVYDGVDFEALTNFGDHFYYGEYQHATAFRYPGYGDIIARETMATPVLWRIMGEEGTDGNITALSEYVLTSASFQENNLEIKDWNNWDKSTIKITLDDIIDNFNISEQNNLNTASEMTTIRFEDNLKINHIPTKLYIPAIVDSSHSYDITWYAKADTNVTEYIGPPHVSGDMNPANTAPLKNGDRAYWWLRTPVNDSWEQDALVAVTSGIVVGIGGHIENGIRPILKLNPKSVIYTSEIKDLADESKGETPSDVNYVSETTVGKKNYKLTLLGSDDSNTLENVPASKRITTGSAMSLTGLLPSKTTGDYTVNYKIVGTVGNGREIIKYGTTPAISVTDLTMDTSDLPNGNYSAYVWLQKNNATTSHEGFDVQNIALTVGDQMPVPVISSADKVVFNEGQAGNFMITASNNPTAFSCIGTLPAGVDFDMTTGILSGTPEIGTANTYPIIFTASNEGESSIAQNFILTVDKVITPINYTVLKYFDEFKGTGTVSISIDALKSKFKDIYIDNEKVDVSQYSVREGSTIITISEALLRSLENKIYDVVIVFDDGTATSTLTINMLTPTIPDANEITLPITGYGNNVASISMFLILIGFGLMGTSLFKKRKV